MAYARTKTEHAGAKNGGGAWMTRAEAKQTAKRQRRREDKVHGELPSFLDNDALEECENRWATMNACEAIREERWQGDSAPAAMRLYGLSTDLFPG